MYRQNIKKIELKKYLIFVIITILLYQDSFIKLTNINILNYIDELFIGVVFIFSLIKSKGKISKFVALTWMKSIIFCVIGIVSCFLFSTYNSTIIIWAPILAVKFYILLGSIILCKPSENVKKYIIKSFKILGTISFFAGIINFLIPELWIKMIPYTYIYERMGLNSSMGLFIHAGQYGWFMMFIAILYLCEYHSKIDKNGYKKFIIYSIAAIFSLKVKVIISFATILFAYEFIINKKKINYKKLFMPAIAVLVIIFSFGNLIMNTYNQYFTENNGQTSARYALLENSIEIIKDYFPFGVGFGKFGSYYAKVYYSEYYFKYNLNSVYGLSEDNPFFATDTFWPAIIGETGILGVIIYIWILLNIYCTLIRNYRKKKFNEKDLTIIVFGILVFLHTLVESTGEPIFNSSPQNIFIAISLGMAISSISKSKQLEGNNDF